MKNLNLYNLRRWVKMLTGNSISHVNQGVGKYYSLSEVKGYYNDLTEKVKRDHPEEISYLPKTDLKNKESVIIPINVFQYGLGVYDMSLSSQNAQLLEKFRYICEWAYVNQEESGAWINFDCIHPDAPYSAMAQGEGASLLIRAYIQFQDIKFLEAARKSIDFMLLSVNDGGTTLYLDEKIYFLEYTNKSVVLNGWIFSIFGLFDYTKVCSDNKYFEILNKTLITLESTLNIFDLNFWSSYNLDNSIITSKFYHDLHISQLVVLHSLFNTKSFETYANRWRNYSKSKLKRIKAFIIKAIQKIFKE